MATFTPATGWSCAKVRPCRLTSQRREFQLKTAPSSRAPSTSRRLKLRQRSSPAHKFRRRPPRPLLRVLLHRRVRFSSRRSFNARLALAYGSAPRDVLPTALPRLLDCLRIETLLRSLRSPYNGAQWLLASSANYSVGLAGRERRTSSSPARRSA